MMKRCSLAALLVVGAVAVLDGGLLGTMMRRDGKHTKYGYDDVKYVCLVQFGRRCGVIFVHLRS